MKEESNEMNMNIWAERWTCLGRDSEINVLNTRLVPPSMTMNPWDESRKIKVIEAIHGKSL